jgi:Na+/alanine symporter
MLTKIKILLKKALKTYQTINGTAILSKILNATMSFWKSNILLSSLSFIGFCSISYWFYRFWLLHKHTKILLSSDEVELQAMLLVYTLIVTSMLLKIKGEVVQIEKRIQELKIKHNKINN